MVRPRAPVRSGLAAAAAVAAVLLKVVAGHGRFYEGEHLAVVDPAGAVQSSSRAGRSTRLMRSELSSAAVVSARAPDGPDLAAGRAAPASDEEPMGGVMPSAGEQMHAAEEIFMKANTDPASGNQGGAAGR